MRLFLLFSLIYFSAFYLLFVIIHEYLYLFLPYCYFFILFLSMYKVYIWILALRNSATELLRP